MSGEGPSPRVAVLARAVFPIHGYGGLERHVHDLVHHLLERGLRVTLITQPPSPTAPTSDQVGQAFDVLRHPNLTIRWVRYRTFPGAGRRGTTVLDRSTAYPVFGERAGRLAAALASEGEVDIVHGLGASALGYARRRRRGDPGLVPFVFNPQGLEEFGATAPERAKLKRWAYLPLRAAVRACARAADRVIATDRSLEPTVRTHLDVEPSRIRLIPNAVDLETIDRLAGPADGQRVRTLLGLGAQQPVLLSVGRLEQNKGFHTLLAPLASLADDAPAWPDAAGSHASGQDGWRWVVIGDGPLAPKLRAELARTGLGSRVALLGRLGDADLHAWYEAATLFLHPGLYEGSSLVTLEAMAHRRAVVGTTAGGIPDKVRPGINGWLVAPGCAEATRAALVEALADRERLHRMGLQGRAIVEHEFSWTAATTRLLEVYAELT